MKIRRTKQHSLLAAIAFFSNACTEDTTPIENDDSDVSMMVTDAGTESEPVEIPVRPTDLNSCATGVAETAGQISIESNDPEDSRLTEISGLIASRTQPVVWVHDDSGNEPNVYAISNGNEGLDDGTPIAIFELAGVAIRDWEDIAIGPGPGPGDHIYIGDIGDKNRDGLGADIVFHRFQEPPVTIPVTAPGVVPAPEEGAVPQFDSIKANYPDGFVENADAFFLDPLSGSTPDIYVVTSGNGITTPNRVFRLSTASPNEITTMEFVTAIFGGDAGDPEVTGADMSADGSMIIMRTLRTAALWQRAANTSVADALGTLPCDALIPMADADSEEGGAIGFTSSSDGYYTSIEGDPAPFWLVPLP